MAKPQGRRAYGKTRLSVTTGGRAVGAIRLSALTDNTSSPERQREIIEGEAGLIQVKPADITWAEDLDLSARKLAPWERPSLSYWLNHPDEFDHLIFWKFDRVCRNVLDAAWLIDWAIKNDVNLVCHSPRLDLSTPLGRGIALFIASIAEMEAENIEERIRDARAYMARVARWPAGKPRYGFQLAPHPSGKGHMLEHHPERGPIVRRIVTEYLRGESFEAIAANLTEDAVPPPATTAKSTKRHGANVWHATAIQKMMTEGLDSLRAFVIVQEKPQRDDKGELLRYGPPLVTDEEAAEITRMVEARAKPQHSRRKDAAPMLGVVKCALCEGNNYLGGAKDKRSYSCNTRGCKGGGILQRYVEPYVEEQFLELVGPLEYTYTVTTVGENHDAELKELEQSMSDLEADRYERGLFKGAVGAQRFAEQYRRLESRHAIVSALPRTEGETKTVHTGLTYARHWEMSNEAERRQALLNAGAVVWVSPAVRRGYADFLTRVRFELLGPAHLHDEGHDDPNAADNWGSA